MKKKYIVDVYKNKFNELPFNIYEKGVGAVDFGPQVIKKYELNNLILDEDNIYYINSLGFRSKEFLKDDAQVITAGCSVSYGMGVPENGVWSSILSDKTKLNVNNLSVPGNSVTILCDRIIKYCEQFGNPEYIMCLFPDFFRYLFVYDNDFHYEERNEKNPPTDPFSIRSMHSKAISHNDGSIVCPPKYTKVPFSIDSGISPHQSVFESINSIYYLEQYCRIAKIKLIWTTWNNTTNEIIKVLKNNINFKLDKYIELEGLEKEFSHPNQIIDSCFIDHENDLISNKAWNFGTDLTINNYTHPGIHFHIHVADFFIKNMNSE